MRKETDQIAEAVDSGLKFKYKIKIPLKRIRNIYRTIKKIFA